MTPKRGMPGYRAVIRSSTRPSVAVASGQYAGPSAAHSDGSGSASSASTRTARLA